MRRSHRTRVYRISAMVESTGERFNVEGNTAEAEQILEAIESDPDLELIDCHASPLDIHALAAMATGICAIVLAVAAIAGNNRVAVLAAIGLFIAGYATNRLA